MKKKTALFFFSIPFILFFFQLNLRSFSQTRSSKGLDSTNFDSVINGNKVGLYEIENRKGMKASFTNFGGRIVSLLVPDKNGKPTDVVLGFNSLQQYIDSPAPYFGAIIGRFANRIKNGKFSIDGKNYQIPVNNGPNANHGGPKGFQYAIWQPKKLNKSTLQFSYLSKDGEMGFPGNLKVTVVYELTEKNELKISYHATTDQKTIINLTNHAFFNLNGEGSGTILNHSLQIFALNYTPIDSTSIPTGDIVSVRNTPFDFTKSHKIGERIDQNNLQLKLGKGYDHNFVLSDSGRLKHAAKIIGDKSGIVMNVYTDQPGLQLYSGNFMAGKNTFKSGAKDLYRTAFCVETQHFPNSPNQLNFPSTILTPEAPFTSVSYFRFSTIQK